MSLPSRVLLASIGIAAVTFALYAAMFLSAGYGAGLNNGRAQAESSLYARNASVDIEQRCSKLAPALMRKCVAEIISRQRENQRSESELAAQWESARWAKWAGAAALAQLLATIVGLYFIKGTLEATLKAVEDTTLATGAMQESNDIARIAQRPWIKINNLNLEDYQLRHSDAHGDFVTIKAKIEVRNIGKLPAMGVSCFPFVWLADINTSSDWLTNQELAVEEAIARVLRRERQLGRMVYPGETDVFPHQSSTVSLPLPGSLPVDQSYPSEVDLNITAVVVYSIGADDWRYAVSTTTLRIGSIKAWHGVGGKKLESVFPHRTVFLDRAN